LDTGDRNSAEAWADLKVGPYVPPRSRKSPCCGPSSVC